MDGRVNKVCDFDTGDIISSFPPKKKKCWFLLIMAKWHDNSHSQTLTKLFLSYINYSGGRSEKVIYNSDVQSLESTDNDVILSNRESDQKTLTWVFVGGNDKCILLFSLEDSLVSVFRFLSVLSDMLNHPAALLLTDELIWPPCSSVVHILHLKIFISKF